MIRQHRRIQKTLVLSIAVLGIHTISASDERRTTPSALVQMIMHCQHDSVSVTLHAEKDSLSTQKTVVITPLQSTVTSGEFSHAIISHGDYFVSQRKTFEYFQQCCQKAGKKETVIANPQPGSPLFDCYKAACYKIERPHQGGAWYLYENSPLMRGSTYGNCW